MHIVHEFADESIIIVRGDDAKLHGHFNVCRHRGSRICLEESGNVNRLVCPYHAWGYALDGKLERAPQMPADFDRDAYGLHPSRVEVLDGLVIINLNEHPGADFKVIADDLSPYLAPHGLDRAKVVHREVYPTYANWKLVVENFRECYHCSPAHPEYAEVNAYVRANAREIGGYEPVIQAWAARTRMPGRETGGRQFPYPPQPHAARRQPIRDGFLSLTEDGSPAGPLMGEFEEYDGAETGVLFGCLSYF